MAKSAGNYLNSQLIKIEAVKGGFAEGIALDPAGYVSEGSGENLFAVVKGKLVTTPLVNSILPGLIETDILRETGPASAQMMGVGSYEALLDLFAQESAIKRLNTVEEVGVVAVMLASDGARNITGCMFPVDGGTMPY